MATHSGAVGMRVFVASDTLAFAALLGAFVVLHSSPAFSGGDAPLSMTTGWILTALLVSSSAALVVASRGRGGGRRPWLLAAAFLGVAFCAVAAAEWRTLVDVGYTLGSSRAADSFYVLTGYHGAHVAGGALYLSWVAATGRGADDLRAVSIYWHFVDAIWLVLFVSLYVVG